MQYNIVFIMKYIIMFIVIAVSCVLMLCVYSITDTALGNAGLNVKPIRSCYFEHVTKISNIDKGSLYLNKKQIDTITEYAKNSYLIRNNYVRDVIYSLYEKNILTDTTDYISINPKSYHEIPDTELPYYAGKLGNIKDMDVSNDEVSTRIKQIMKEDIKTEEKVAKHFVIHLQEYLVQQHILQSKQLNIAAITNKISSMEIDINKGLEKISLTSTHRNRDTSITKASDLHSQTINRKRTIPRDNKDDVDNVSSKLRKLRLSEGIRSDMKDRTHPHMSLFGVLSILCSVVATLALCAITAHYITKKNINKILHTL